MSIFLKYSCFSGLNELQLSSRSHHETMIEFKDFQILSRTFRQYNDTLELYQLGDDSHLYRARNKLVSVVGVNLPADIASGRIAAVRSRSMSCNCMTRTSQQECRGILELYTKVIERYDFMRRRDREITDKQDILEVMRKCDVCRIALHDGDYPYIVPLNFGLQVENDMPVLYFHGALEGKKYELIEKDNRASFEMDCGHQLILDKAQGNCAMEYESVIGQGYIEMLNEEEKYEALRILMKQYRREDFPFNEKVIPMTAVFRLRVGSMTGKRRTKKSNKLKIYAMNAIDNAYAPYSDFKVGACVELTDGQYITGSNVENASYGLSNCAERSAIFAAYSRGYRKEDIKAMAITTHAEKLTMPCGACRQVLSELLLPDTPILIANDKEEKILTMRELLPYSFGEDDLKK